MKKAIRRCVGNNGVFANFGGVARTGLPIRQRISEESWLEDDSRARTFAGCSLGGCNARIPLVIAEFAVDQIWSRALAEGQQGWLSCSHSPTLNKLKPVRD